MGKITTLSAENFTLGTGSVLAALQTAAAGSLAAIVRLKRLEITQRGTSTLQQIGGVMSKRDTAGTLTTTSTTPQTTRPVGGPASGLAGNTNVLGGTGRSGTNSSADSGGSYTDLDYFDFPNLNGYLWKEDDRGEMLIPASTVWVVRLVAAPTTLTGWTVKAILEEE